MKIAKKILWIDCTAVALAGLIVLCDSWFSWSTKNIILYFMSLF